MHHQICSADLPGKPENMPNAAQQLRLAANERVDNVRVRSQRNLIGVRRAVVEKFKLWENDRTIRIKFMDGDPGVQAKVRDAANIWMQYVNLQFDWVTDGLSDIRISFLDQGSSWSYVGTDASHIPHNEATMNYGWLYPETEWEEYLRVVVHEFGHALGMGHEHQNPDAAGKIPWDTAVVYAYYARQGWTTQDVDHNVLNGYTSDVTNFSQYDKYSIMHYAIPNSMTIGDWEVGWNTALSAHDKTFMALQYPRADVPPVTELPVATDTSWSMFQADLASGGEVDTYHFIPNQNATYIMKTEGVLNTILTLHGPNDSTKIVAWNDDSGALSNGKITKKLVVGQNYWLTVRNKSAEALPGDYSIGIKRRKCLLGA